MWARVISVVCHPLFMPTYFFSLLALTLPGLLEPVVPELHLKFIAFIFLVTAVLPLMNVWIFRTFGTIRSFSMYGRRERLLPFVFVSVIYVVITYLFHVYARMNFHDNFFKFMVIIDMLVLVATVATFFFKVSVHSVCIWGLIGILVPLNKITEVSSIFYPTVGLILLAGFVMSARLKLGAHNPREVMWGAVLGLASGVAGMSAMF